MKPVDTTTGQQCGGEVHGVVYVLKGYLITHSDGYEARLGPDRAKAEAYAVRSHATLEPLFVKRTSL